MRTKDQILADIEPLRKEMDDLEERERKAEHQALIGRCFKYRNSYGGDRESWWLYTRVWGSDGYWPKCFSFEITSRDIIEIKPADHHRVHPGNGWTEIPLREYNAAWRKVQQRIAKVKFK